MIEPAGRCIAGGVPGPDPPAPVCSECGATLEAPRAETAFGRAIAGRLAALPALCDGCAAGRRGAEAAAQQSTVLAAAFEDALARGDLRPLFRATGFGRSDPAKERDPGAWAAARAWARDRCVYIAGEQGVGKSYLGRCLLRRVFEAGGTVAEAGGRQVAVVATAFGDRARARWARWQEVRGLLLDDLDKLERSERALLALWELLDARAQPGRVTICTANLTLRQMVEVWAATSAGLAAGVADRLEPLLYLRLSGDSLRGAGL